MSFLDSLRLTEEQRRVVELDPQTNVCVVACPGSGKTTTLMAKIVWMVRSGVKPQDICICTYNKSLGEEIKTKILESVPGVGIREYFHVGTIDSLCYRFLPHMLRSDPKLLAHNFCQYYADRPLIGYPQYVLYDEGQDLNKYHSVVLGKISERGYVCIVGDPRQCIYKSLGADSEYMFQIADQCAARRAGGDGSAVKQYLSSNFRSTNEIIEFVNSCFNAGTGYPPIRAARGVSGDKAVLTLMHSRTPKGRISREEVVTMYADAIDSMVSSGYKASDIAILAPSVRNATERLLNGIETELVARGSAARLYKNLREYGCERPLYEIPEDSVYCGTVHSSKGLEWPVVFLCNFYLGAGAFKSAPETRELLYVACTRARDNMFIMETTHCPKECSPIPELLQHGGTLEENIVNVRDRTVKNIEQRPRMVFGVTELLTYLSVEQTLRLRVFFKDVVSVGTSSFRLSYPHRFLVKDNALYGTFIEQVITRELMRTRGDGGYFVKFPGIVVDETQFGQLVSGHIVDPRLKELLSVCRFDIVKFRKLLGKARGNKDAMITNSVSLGVKCVARADMFYDQVCMLRTKLARINDSSIATWDIIDDLWQFTITTALFTNDLGYYHVRRVTSAELKPIGIDSWCDFIGMSVRNLQRIGEYSDYQGELAFDRNGVVLVGQYDLRTVKNEIVDIKTYNSEDSVCCLGNKAQVCLYDQMYGAESGTNGQGYGFVYSSLTGSVYSVGCVELTRGLMDTVMTMCMCKTFVDFSEAYRTLDTKINWGTGAGAAGAAGAGAVAGNEDDVATGKKRWNKCMLKTVVRR